MIKGFALLQIIGILFISSIGTIGIYTYYHPTQKITKVIPSSVVSSSPTVQSQVSPVPLVPIATSQPLPSPIQKSTENLYQNQYFSLEYPQEWSSEVVSLPGALVAWQTRGSTVTFQVTVKRASYSYEAYQYHVSVLSNHPSKDETYSSLSEKKLAGVTALSYIHTTVQGEYTQTTWLSRAGLEYTLTWVVTGNDAATRDQRVQGNQDTLDMLLSSFSLTDNTIK